jgi:DNA-binding response OmpR family regulator
MINILIIDDDNEDSDFLREAIQQVSPKTNCTIVRNAAEAIKDLYTKKFARPGLIFLDICMPRVNGMEYLKELKRNPHVSDIPVIIYTTSKSQHDRTETLKLGASNFITKPTGFRLLCMIITDIFIQEKINIARY